MVFLLGVTGVPRSYSEGHRLAIAHATFTELEGIGALVVRSASPPRVGSRLQWKETVSCLIIEPREVFGPASKQKSLEFPVSGHPSVDPESFWRALRDTLHAEHFPTAESLEKVLEVAARVAAQGCRYDLLFPMSIEQQRDLEVRRQRLLKYRSELVRAPETDLPSYDMCAPVDPWKELERDVQCTLENLRDRPRTFEAIQHRFVLDGFEQEMRTLLSLAKAGRQSIRFDIHAMHRQIQASAFHAEWRLLEFAFQSGETYEAFFSDSGFDDSGRRAVWSEELPRLNVLMTLQRARLRCSGLKFHRIVILGSKQRRDYSDGHLVALAADVMLLLRYGVRVHIGLKRDVLEADSELFNYALITDGTVMRASEGHRRWQLARVKPSHAIFIDLRERYAQMLRSLKTPAVDSTPTTYQPMRRNLTWFGVNSTIGLLQTEPQVLRLTSEYIPPRLYLTSVSSPGNDRPIWRM